MRDAEKVQEGDNSLPRSIILSTKKAGFILPVKGERLMLYFCLFLFSVFYSFFFASSLNNRAFIRYDGKRVSNFQISATEGDACGPCPLAPKCSGEWATKGCDGEGRVRGGLSTVPGFGWLPVKVYRPCPSYLAAGYTYKREGQTLDQVLFSEPSTKMKQKIEEIRAAEEATAASQRDALSQAAADAKAARLADAEKSGTAAEQAELDKFLEDRFGSS